MMKKRFTEEQIIGILNQQEKGVKVMDLIRRHNISEQTFYHRKSKYAAVWMSVTPKLKRLEDENRRLKQLVGELTLDKQALQWIIEKNF